MTKIGEGLRGAELCTKFSLIFDEGPLFQRAGKKLFYRAAVRVHFGKSWDFRLTGLTFSVFWGVEYILSPSLSQHSE